ncbi:hypothetical protein HMPREF9447_00041 [Bacteroides oleiciplenus YIT 12058]|uniref:Uncharacterized protein n=1 Tax=Bacteroides oleiciplenus YIT 12058 TaxID=742727 RepID=K9E5J5_9BACE|nr:hypothetical protein HMPREF9447_00041 [Bacteroides oleiciplenus YIT 12058]
MSYQEKYRCLFFYPKRKTAYIHRSGAYLRFYQDSVDLLKKIFNRLNLIVDGKPAIRIADPEVLRILIDTTEGDENKTRNEKDDSEKKIKKKELATKNKTASKKDNEYERMKDKTKNKKYNEVN